MKSKLVLESVVVMWWWLMLLVLLESEVVESQVTIVDNSTIDVQITVRSFMPAWCMPNKSYVESWGSKFYGGFPSGISPDEASQGIPDIDIEENSNTRNCSYFNEILEGLVSGHPYMEDGHRGGGPSNEQLFMYGPQLNKAISGLYKPVHCKFFIVNETTGQTYCPDTLRTPSVEDFDALFSDSYKYNKRSGFVLRLYFDQERGKFRYNSQLPEQEENIQFGLTDNDDDGNLVDAFDRTEINANQVEERFFGPLDRFCREDSPYRITEALYPDPFSEYMEAWPQVARTKQPEFSFFSNDARIPRTRFHQFWFTSELHITFQYKGGEIFNFNVQDFAFVYINQRLALALDASQRATEGLINLDDLAEEFGLEIGGIYDLAGFGIEHHTGGSAWLFETTLVEVCNVLQSGSLLFSLSEGREQLVKSEDVEVSENKLRLSKQGSLFSTGYAFLPEPVNVGTGFVFDFAFSISGGKTDGGFAVVIHRRNQGLRNMPVSGASQLGFKGFDHSVVVAFDFCADRKGNDPLKQNFTDHISKRIFGENSVCNLQQVRLHYLAPDGDGTEVNRVSVKTLKVNDLFLNNLKTGRKHRVRIDYLETPDHFNVIIDDSLFLREDNFNLETIIGGRDAFIGFTSGQSILTRDVDISDIELKTVDLEFSRTSFDGTEGGLNPGVRILDIDNETEPVLIVADGEDFADFVFRTRDFCGNPIEFGGSGEEFYVAVTDLNSNETVDIDDKTSNTTLTVLDRGDGSYGVRFISTVTSDFSLFVTHGINCGALVGGSVIAKNEECFYYFNPFAISTLAVQPTPPPTFAPTSPGDKFNYLIVYIASAGACLVCCLLGVVAVFNNKYRRKFFREREFIVPGQIELLNKKQSFAANNEMTRLHTKDEEIRLQLLQEQSKLQGNLGSISKMNELTREKHNLVTTIKDRTKNTEVQNVRKMSDEDFAKYEAYNSYNKNKKLSPKNTREESDFF